MSFRMTPPNTDQSLGDYLENGAREIDRSEPALAQSYFASTAADTYTLAELEVYSKGHGFADEAAACERWQAVKLTEKGRDDLAAPAKVKETV